MAEHGYVETINFSFVEERWERELAGNDNPIRVLNPIASPLAVMRSSLVGSLVQVLRYNLARKASRVRVFEIGRVFLRDPSIADSDTGVAGIHQPMRLAGLAYGSADELQWGVKERQVDFFDVKGDIEALLAPRAVRFVPAAHPALHPGRAAQIEVDGRTVGVIGELHPRWRQSYDLPTAPVLFELELDALMKRDLPRFDAIPRHQSVWRDIAVVANESVTHEALIHAIHETPTPLVRSAQLFDIYKPTQPAGDIHAGERSLAVRLEMLDDENVLTDERIEAAKAQVLDTLKSRLGVRLRS
jgi:phenylalanyl-tRNA synthetase beta chain